MKQEYTFAKGWRIFIYILSPILMFVFGGLGIMPYVENAGLGIKVFLTILSIALECLMVLGLIDMYKGKLILEKDAIISIGVFKVRTLKLSEIKGFTKIKIP